MAKNKGPFKLSGTIGNATFSNTQDGNIVSEKTSLNKKRFKTDKRLDRTRENAAEFGRAVESGSLLRRAMQPLVKKIADGRVTSRMNQLFSKILRLDTFHKRGERSVKNIPPDLLEGFDFNIRHSLKEVFPVLYFTNMDTCLGHMQISIPSFRPDQRVNGPGAATHFRVVSAGAALDFGRQCFVNSLQETELMPLDETASAPILLRHALAVDAGQSLFLSLGIVFYVAGEKGPYQEVAGGAMAVVHAGVVEKPGFKKEGPAPEEQKGHLQEGAG